MMNRLTRIAGENRVQSKIVWDDPGVVRIIPLVKGTETDGRDQFYSLYRQSLGNLKPEKKGFAHLLQSANQGAVAQISLEKRSIIC
jgi:hypothetical protein